MQTTDRSRDRSHLGSLVYQKNDDGNNNNNNNNNNNSNNNNNQIEIYCNLAIKCSTALPTGLLN